jgi:hypothetical protein
MSLYKYLGSPCFLRSIFREYACFKMQQIWQAELRSWICGSPSTKLSTKILNAFLKHNNGPKWKDYCGILCFKSLNSCILLKCFKNLCKTCPKDRSNLQLSVNLGSDMDWKGQDLVGQSAIHVHSRGPKFSERYWSKPPKFSGPGTGTP